MNESSVLAVDSVALDEAGLRWLSSPWQVEDCTRMLDHLIQTIQWHADSYEAFGRRFQIPRLQAWFAEAGIQYRYANNFLPRQDWTVELRDLKQNVEAICECSFNSVLATYYRDGMDSVGWHADDEAELGAEPWIVSLSLGAEREFRYRHKTTGVEGFTLLRNGDLLLMEPGFQQHWEHSVPSQPLVQAPRINLTFRQVQVGTATP